MKTHAWSYGLALLVGFSTLAQATLMPLWEQSPTTFMSGSQSSAEPHATPSSLHAAQRVADDFYASKDSSILALTWWGASSDGMLSEIDSIDQVTAFKIEFFDSDACTGCIGTSLYQTVVDASQTQATRTGLEMLGGSDVFQHSVTLPESVEVSADKRYWVSVSALRDDEPLWVWFHGQNFNYEIAVDHQVNGIWNDSLATPGVHQDMAFVVMVPEPASLMFISLGALGLTCRRRRIRS